MRYDASNTHLLRALKSIPTGSQTFSKSHYSLPKGASPLFIERGLKSRVWDIDGNEYVDLINGLLSVSIGYCDPDIDLAIKNQLKNGISFSLPHILEAEVAEKLIHLIPCAEMVRFGKNGTDVTSAAIRLARAFTGKNRVAICGYHGWQDWYIGTTSRNLGVPNEVADLSVTFKFNDVASLTTIFDQYPDVGAVILEPMAAVKPTAEFLTGIRRLCDEHGAVLIFDEMITGFRLDKGGAQSLFGVTPDLATFGKGMANGMPISAIVGNREIMNFMDKIFFSGTFGGETLSLAAANCVIDKYIDLPVTEHLFKMGERLTNGIDELVAKHKVDWYSLIGHESWKVMSISHPNPNLMKSILIEQLCLNGVLTIGTHNISYATDEYDVLHILKAYDMAFQIIQAGDLNGQLASLQKGKIIEPIFKVR